MRRANLLLRLIPIVAIAAAFAGCSTDWPAFRHNGFRSAAQLNASDLSNPAKVPSLAVKWRFPKVGDPDLGGGFRASPVIWKGRVFIGNGNGRLYALDANTGVKLWQYPLAADPPLVSSFVCNPSSEGLASSATIGQIGGQDAVIFAAPDKSIGTGLGEGRLFALNTVTGAVIWKSPVIARVTGTTSQSKTEFHENLGYSAPIVWGNKVYVGIGDHCDNPIQKGRVAAVDLATGTLVAGFDYCSTGACVAADTTRGGGVWSPIAASGTAVYITTGNTKSGAATEPVPNRGLSMLRLDGATGAVAWQFQPVPWILDADPDWSAGVSVMPFASCGPRVISTMKDGWTHALNDSGVRQWTFPPATVPFSAGDGTVHMDTRYMRSGAVWGDVYITMNGGLNVTTNVSAGYKRLHALNVCSSPTDRVRWLIDVPGASGATYSLGPPTVTRGIVFVGTDQGHVVAIADPSLVPPAGYRCIHPDVTAANCVAMGYTLVPQPAVLADITVTGSMVYTEPAIANGKLYVATGGFTGACAMKETKMLRDLAAAVLLSMLMTTALAQERQEYKRNPAEPLPLEPIERFTGPLLATRNRALANARVVFRHWHISNDQRVEIPHQGFLVVHLHAGEITVISGGERRERRGDEFWTVAPGEPLIVETGRDSVVLRTLDTITAP